MEVALTTAASGLQGMRQTPRGAWPAGSSRAPRDVGPRINANDPQATLPSFNLFTSRLPVRGYDAVVGRRGFAEITVERRRGQRHSG
jgi:hypothetical protein